MTTPTQEEIERGLTDTRRQIRHVRIRIARVRGDLPFSYPKPPT